MYKFAIFLTLLGLFSGLSAGLGESPTTTQKGNVDVSKPTFFNILLRNPDVFDDIPEGQSITVFAPSDKAFSQLSPKFLKNLMKPENEKALKKLMNAHVVKGDYTTKDLKNGMVLVSEEGKELKIKVDKNGEITVNGALIIEPNAIIRRGTLHVINRVLVPKSITVEELKESKKA